MTPEQLTHLPIDDIMPQVIAALSGGGANETGDVNSQVDASNGAVDSGNAIVDDKSGALVLVAAPGAGKTTRVPPAILDAGLAGLGQIVVLQPRRVAARAAATRISDERGTKLGDEIGYQVRHESRMSARTRILVCTEGVFLRRLQKDPLLENVAVVIFDEFHERSLDSDLALALVKQVRDELRPDLKIIVMSATLDSEPVSRYLSDCPVVKSPGRTYPVDIQYLAAQPGAKIEQTVSDGIKRIVEQSRTYQKSSEQKISSEQQQSSEQQNSGHILAFLPGIGEIRKTQDLLDSFAERENLLVLPLYGDMPLEEQQKVLNRSNQRKVILATNIAETSLTIDGVTAVVDSGMARVNRLDTRLGLNRLGLERISKASADQRAGRAGRMAPGTCLRLWSEREQQNIPDFTSPEIERVDLSECALQLLAWGEKDLDAFAWFEAPPPASLSRALELLNRLDAVQNNSVTELGRRMAQFPLQPRLARLLIEGARLGQTKRTALCAALLSERDPIKRNVENTGAAHKSESDVLDRIWALEEYSERGHKHTFVGELLVNPAKQILRSADQLAKLVSERKDERAQEQLNKRADEQLNERSSKKPTDSLTESIAKASAKPSAKADQKLADSNDKESDQAVMRALMSAFVDRICKRREPGGKTAVMVGGRGVRLSNECAVTQAEFFVAVELVETGQSDATVRQASAIEKSWLPQNLISTTTDVVYDSEREKVVAFNRTRFCDILISEAITAIPSDVDAGEVLANALGATKIDLASMVDEESLQFLARLDCLRQNAPELDLPQFSNQPWRDLLPQWCMGISTLAELKSRSLLSVLQSQLTYDQLSTLDREAPEKLQVPSGNTIKVHYEAGNAPVLAVRIQELFGMVETPRVARSRQPVLMHLLAPNYRVQQITPDLASFWKNTYNEVKKDLKARYPKHSWPDNPLTAQAESRPKRKL